MNYKRSEHARHVVILRGEVIAIHSERKRDLVACTTASNRKQPCCALTNGVPYTSQQLAFAACVFLGS